MRIYAYIAAALIVLAAGWWIDRRAVQRTVAEWSPRVQAAQSALALAVEANGTGTETIANLQSALDACERARVFDVNRAAEAAASAEAERDRIAAQAAAERDRRLALQSGECRAWAQQPACGSLP